MRGTINPIVLSGLLLGAACAAGAEPLPAPALSPGVHRLERLAPVSDTFVAELEAAVRSVPDEIWRSLAQAGWRVAMAESVVDAAPYLRGVAPRGWPEGTVWENTDAVHLPATRQLVIAEKRRNKRGQIVSCTRVAGVLRHELGHAYDMVAGGGGTFRSAAPPFLAAYRADIAGMSEEGRRKLVYYLQPNEAGRQETFAEAFAVVFGGGSDMARQVEFTAHFTRTIELLRQAVPLAPLASSAAHQLAPLTVRPLGR